MLQFFRKFLSSRFGAAIAIGVLILIALAFASGDVATRGGFGGVAGGDRVALVGGERIASSTLREAVTSALERAKQDNPKMSMKGLLASGGLDQILDSLIDRTAVAVFGKQHGIIAGDRLVDSEIAKVPAFHGADGKFSETLYKQALRQRGISEQILRDDLRQGLIVRQVMTPASFGAIMQREPTERYAQLLTETRQGEVAVLPSMLFAPDKPPTDEQIAAYYQKNKNDFIRPERRVIRYASFDAGIVKDVAKPSEAEIEYRYKANADKYKASEKREIRQLIVPTEAAANAVIAETEKGKSLEQAAKEKGLSVAQLEPADRDSLARQFSEQVADAAFAASSGKIAKPARGPLGWHVMRIEKIEKTPARTLADVRDDIAQQITQQKQNAALSEKLEQIEDDLDSGSNLVEEAKSLDAKVETTKPVTADGKVYAEGGGTVPEVLKPVLETAFQMDIEQPQLAIIQRGSQFVIYDVTQIFPSAPAPLKEIKDDVKKAYTLDKASAAARAEAVKVQAAVRKGESLRKAMASVHKRLLPPQPVRMSRPQLVEIRRKGEGVPAPLALLFQMAADTVKVQAAPNKQAWFIVKLDKIEPGKLKKDDPELDQAQQDLGGLLGDEYADALQRAIRKEIGVQKNPAAIRAVRGQLVGSD